jgi:hypothetical protein
MTDSVSTTTHRMRMHMLRHPLLALLFCSIAAVSASAQNYPDDTSLPIAEYLALGVPPVDRPWSVDDYKTAVFVLDSIGQAQPGALPQYQSERSGALFARLVAIDNAQAADPTITDAVKLNGMLPLTQEFANLMRIYTAPGAQGIVFDNELAELLGYFLSTADTVAALATRVITEAGQAAILKDTTNGALIQMRSGLTLTAVGAIEPMGVMEPLETSALRLPARRRLAAHVGAHVPAIAPLLTDSGRAEVRAQLARVLRVEKDAGIRGILQKLDATLAKKTKGAKTSGRKSKRN